MSNKFLKVIWPIETEELKKFLPMACMMICILFNYNSLRSLKDALVVPNIGAEAVSFIKLYCVVPAAIILMLVYSKLTNIMSQEKIFMSFASFFLAWFMLFAFVLYPNIDIIHPDAAGIEHLITTDIDFGLFTLHMAHFKWFLLIYSKWSFALFYVLAELWGSAMLSLLFWQFANHITRTSEAKRFYPMFGFVGNIGLVIAGFILKSLFAIDLEGDTPTGAVANTDFAIKALLSLTSFCAVIIMCIYYYMQKHVLTDPRYYVEIDKVSKKNKPKLTLLEGLKVIFSSRYLGYIAIMVLAYGITINLVEGPWKAKVREFCPDTTSYANFMGTLTLYTGAASMILMLVGTNILVRFGWFVGAIITPLVIFVTGLGFFLFVVFYNSPDSYLATSLALNPLFLAVMFGLVQNILSKATKYSLFDPTKEMSYIPIDNELKTKGKAAVDVVAARVAKSGSALIQSGLFMIFPAATFVTISPYLMAIFFVVSVIWLIDVKVLNREYNNSLSKSPTAAS